jgi:hypothetical protein
MPAIFCVGCAMVYCGFRLWYLKVQKYQDKQLRLSADGLERSNRVLGGKSVESKRRTLKRIRNVRNFR